MLSDSPPNSPPGSPHNRQGDVPQEERTFTFTEFHQHVSSINAGVLNLISRKLLSVGTFVQGVNTKYILTNEPPTNYTQIRYTKDIDSVAFITDTIPFVQNVNVTIYPRPDYYWSYHNNTGIKYHDIPLYKIPNIDLMRINNLGNMDCGLLSILVH